MIFKPFERDPSVYIFGYSTLHERVAITTRHPFKLLNIYSYTKAFSNEYNMFIKKLLNFDL